MKIAIFFSALGVFMTVVTLFVVLLLSSQYANPEQPAVYPYEVIQHPRRTPYPVYPYPYEVIQHPRRTPYPVYPYPYLGPAGPFPSTPGIHPRRPVYVPARPSR